MENFKYMLWVIADYWGYFPLTNIALQGGAVVVRTPSTPQVYYLYVLLLCLVHGVFIMAWVVGRGVDGNEAEQAAVLRHSEAILK